jgi:membrane-bound lytic murein transglycosylase B
LVCFAALGTKNSTAASEHNSINKDTLNEEGFKNWLPELREIARKRGISARTVAEALGNAKFIERAVKLDRKQPHSTMTFNRYLTRVIPDSRVKAARRHYQKNLALLTRIGQEYGVQPRFIVALWAIESNFGQNMGGFNIVDSLATLAYEGRRRTFFTNELINALKIIDEGNIHSRDMKGSWAGAMGQTQFMPSSYLELAADGNHDGKKDIWTTKADVFASIANYLSKRGWDNHMTWGREVKLPYHFNVARIGLDTQKKLKAWSALGVKKANGAPLPNNFDFTASLVQPDEGGDTFIVYSNYRTIMKWNRSTYFATAVGILADKIVGMR